MDVFARSVKMLKSSIQIAGQGALRKPCMFERIIV